MNFFAIDPGTLESGVVLFNADDRRIVAAGVEPNKDVIELVRCLPREVVVVSEMIASYGMPVGREVFETCVWIGRFMQAAPNPDDFRLIYRQDVKLHLCGSPRAKDPNVRQALIDLLGKPGTKKAPGGTYGVSSHAWAALGVAVTAAGLRRLT